MRKPVTSIQESRLFPHPEEDNTPPPQTPGPAALPNRSLIVLEVHHGKIIHAAKRSRTQRSIAREFGVGVNDIWDVVVEELRSRRAA